MKKEELNTETAQQAPPIKKRLLSLDALRGITVAGMILVNNAGGKVSYAPLQHSAWNGLTLCDLVFPFFLFIMGISTYISYVNIKRPTHKVGQVYTKIDINPRFWIKERLALMRTQVRLLYNNK